MATPFDNTDVALLDREDISVTVPTQAHNKGISDSSSLIAIQVIQKAFALNTTTNGIQQQTHQDYNVDCNPFVGVV